MLVPSILVFSLFTLSDALRFPTFLDSGPAPFVEPIARPVLGPVGDLHLVNEFVAPDGFNRTASVINGIFPGPLIQAKKGDDFVLRVSNELTNTSEWLETSIHWHGIFQHRSNWADGVAFVTQCPLRQNEAFTHRFNARGQTGTYWYHSHYKTQYCDGVKGPLIIYDPFDPLGYLYDVDDESTVITLSDWYHESSVPLSTERKLVVPDSTLINGLGRYSGGPASPLAVVNVTEGFRYRFRLVSLSCSASFNFSIDGHRMTIIEADGNEVVPVEVDWVVVYAAQRYSVVVTANQPIGNYWIRALSNFNASVDNDQNLAILRYEGAPVQDPTSPPGPYILGFDETILHPLINPRAPGIPGVGNADRNFALVPGIDSVGFTFNNVSFVPPTVPILLQILSGARHATDFLPNGSVYELPPNKVIEINFPNPANAPGGPHPIHLHGHAFSVVRSANSSVYNYDNPVRRDVVSIGENTNDNVTIRFITDNPGPWFLHCHIDWHLNLGFAVVMAEAPRITAVQQARVMPPDWGRICLPNQMWGQTVLGGLFMSGLDEEDEEYE